MMSCRKGKLCQACPVNFKRKLLSRTLKTHGHTPVCTMCDMLICVGVHVCLLLEERVVVMMNRELSF